MKNLVFMSWRKLHLLIIILILSFLFISNCYAAGGEGDNPVVPVLFQLLVVIIAAKLGGHLAVVFKQPEVLGELIVGLVVGNLWLFGFTSEVFDFLKHDRTIEVLSELGVILLLFEVGLETDLKEMSKLGTSAFFVALLGVVVPFILGYYVTAYFVPEESFLAHVFAGATLAATSVGITVRVLKDLKVLNAKESKIILGAAVLDDVMGLLVLAVVSGMIKAKSLGSDLDISSITKVFLLAIGFLVGAVIVGRSIAPTLFKIAASLKTKGMLLATTLLVCFSFSYLAYLVGLAPIVGAFTAGLILDRQHYKKLLENSNYNSIEDLINPITSVLVPIFFISMGARVDISVFGNFNILGFALALSVAAIVGKQVCGLGVCTKGVDRVAVGFGMIPRGEVGLIFIAIGSKMILDGQPVVDPSTFGSVVIVVVVTTMIAPSLLKWRFAKLIARSA